MRGLGRVTQVSPLRVQRKGDTTDAPATAASDFTGATANAATGTEVVIETIDGRRIAWRLY